ncbi:hypothetical protein [Bradyrhizobium sp. RDI18]|uniref:hypothetical protein n=1 Tax=Bradyrhizobium sp. RDI18 TaxID=3367400 RepID=UPI003712A796
MNPHAPRTTRWHLGGGCPGLFAREQNDLGNLRRQEALEPAHAFDLGDLLRDALLERAVPVGEFVHP